MGREIRGRVSGRLVMAPSGPFRISATTAAAGGNPGYVAWSSSIFARSNASARKGLWTPEEPSPAPSAREPGLSRITLNLAPSAAVVVESVVEYSVGGMVTKSDK